MVVPGKMTVEEYLESKRADGEIDPFPPMRDVTPARHYTPPEPIDYMAEAPIPGSRPHAAADATPARHPTGTRLSSRGD